MLSNKYEFYLDSEMTYEQLKDYVVSNSYIKLYSSGTRPYGNGGWERVPKEIEIKTNNIVWFEEDEGFHERLREHQEDVERCKQIINELKQYKIKWYHKMIASFNFMSLNTVYLEENLDWYSSDYCQRVLDYCKSKNIKKNEM